MKRVSLLVFSFCLLVSFTSCKVDFSPNASWKDIPAVYCVVDPEEDTVWARVQRVWLSEDNLYQYATVYDSINYAPGQISVHLLAWEGIRGSGNTFSRGSRVLHRWQFADTVRDGKPDGLFAGGMQPLFYCVPDIPMVRDTACILQLVVIDNASGDTLAQAFTDLLGMRPKIRLGSDSVERVLVSPSLARGNEFGYRVGCRGKISWNTIPRGRRYQPIVTLFYEKHGDTLGIQIPGMAITDASQSSVLNTTSITQDRLLSYVKNALADNRDTLYNINNVDITIAVCNEDLNAYLGTQEGLAASSQGQQVYTNIQGGMGIFGSRRSHIVANVPCDSVGKTGYLPYELKNLHVGFYGDFGGK